MSSLSTASSDVAAPTSSTFPSSPSSSSYYYSSSSSSYSASHLLRVLVPDLMSLVLAHLNQRDFISAQQICCTFHRASSMSTSTPRQLDIARIIAMVRHASDAYPSYTQPTWKDDAQENILYHRTLTDSMRIFALARRGDAENEKVRSDATIAPILPRRTNSIALWENLTHMEYHGILHVVTNEYGQQQRRQQRQQNGLNALIDISSRASPWLHDPTLARRHLVEPNNQAAIQAFFTAVAHSLQVLVTHSTFLTVDLSLLTHLRVLSISSVVDNEMDGLHQLESFEISANFTTVPLMRKVHFLSSHHSLTSFTTRGTLSPSHLRALCDFDKDELKAMLEDDARDNVYNAMQSGEDILEGHTDENAASAAQRHYHVNEEMFLHTIDHHQPLSRLTHISFAHYTSDLPRDEWLLYILSARLPHVTAMSTPGIHIRLKRMFQPSGNDAMMHLAKKHQAYLKDRLAKLNEVTIRHDRSIHPRRWVPLHVRDELNDNKSFSLFAPSLIRLHLHDFDDDVHCSNLLLRQTVFSSLSRLQYLTIQPKPAFSEHTRDTITQPTFNALSHLSSLRVLALRGAFVGRELWNIDSVKVLASLPHFESWQLNLSASLEAESSYANLKRVTTPSLELTAEMLNSIATSRCWRSVIFISHEVDDWYITKHNEDVLQKVKPQHLQSRLTQHFRVEFNQHEYRIRKGENGNEQGKSSTNKGEYHWLRVWDGASQPIASGAVASSCNNNEKAQQNGCRCVIC